MSGGSLGYLGGPGQLDTEVVGSHYFDYAVEQLRTYGHADVANELQDIKRDFDAAAARVDAFRNVLVTLDRVGSGDDGSAILLLDVEEWRRLTGRATTSCLVPHPKHTGARCVRWARHEEAHADQFDRRWADNV